MTKFYPTEMTGTLKMTTKPNTHRAVAKMTIGASNPLRLMTDATPSMNKETANNAVSN